VLSERKNRFVHICVFDHVCGKSRPVTVWNSLVGFHTLRRDNKHANMLSLCPCQFTDNTPPQGDTHQQMSRAAGRVWLVIVAIIFALVGSSRADDAAPLNASIFVGSNGSIHVLSNIGQDVLLNNISVNGLAGQISSLLQSNGQISAENSMMRVALSSIGSQLSSLMSLQSSRATSTQVTTTTSDPVSITTTLLTTTNEPMSTKSTAAPISACLSQPNFTPIALDAEYETFASFKLADGSVFLVAAQDSRTVLLEYSNDARSGVSYDPSQTLVSSFDTAKVCAFNAGPSQYLAVPYYFDFATYDVHVELFAFDENVRQLVSVQNISTYGAVGVSAVTTTEGDCFLSISNYLSQAKSYNNPSFILRFNDSSLRFDHWQNVTTHGSYPSEFFSIASATFLAIPNYYNGSTWLVDSMILRFDATSRMFVVNQSITTFGCTHLKPWTRGSMNFLTIVSNHGQFADTYIFNTSIGRFENVTNGARIFASYPQGADVVNIAGETYMVLGPNPQVATITLYRWNDPISGFTKTQQISVAITLWMYPHFFKTETDAYLAVADRIYIFCSGKFVLT
jgi:hypothetical protein